jgi:hypothetical protein
LGVVLVLVLVLVLLLPMRRRQFADLGVHPQNTPHLSNTTVYLPLLPTVLVRVLVTFMAGWFTMRAVGEGQKVPMLLPLPLPPPLLLLLLLLVRACTMTQTHSQIKAPKVGGRARLTIGWGMVRAKTMQQRTQSTSPW